MSWSRHLVAAGAGLLVLGGSMAAGPSLRTDATDSVSASATLAQLDWLAGCWELRTARRTTVEMWMPPDGGLMLGASRTVTGGIARAFEHLRLHQHGDTVTYTAIPSGQREASFRATHVSDSGFTVENPAHDFPQRIIYTRRGVDSLIARVEGPSETGTRGFDLPMKRVACHE
jgi:hypothetical protein